MFRSIKNKNSFYVLGVSGGPDSMFLLDKMRKLKYKLIVAHVNYKKRNTSDYDEKIVSDYCNKFKINFLSLNPKNYEKGNFQSLARKIRYDFFFSLANKFSTKNIVIAHNFEDSLETYQLQLKRKSLFKCWGLQFVSFQKEYFIFRPILSFKKNEIFRYLKNNKIHYGIDETNYSLIYERNIVRKKIFSLSDSEKNDMMNEIIKKNKDLDLINNELKNKSINLINKNILHLNNEWFSSSLEIKKRLIYNWVNDCSEGKFLQRKKSILTEIIKQLSSKKNEIIINIGENFRIKKKRNIAFIDI